MWSWDRVAPVSKDAWFKTGPSLAAHAESVIEVRRQDPKNKMTMMRWGMFPGSLIISRHSTTQLWVPSSLACSVILRYSRPSTAEWRSRSQARPAWQHVHHETGHGHRHVLTNARSCVQAQFGNWICPIKSLTHLFAKPLSSYNCPFVSSVGSSHTAEPHSEKHTVTVVEGAVAA